MTQANPSPTRFHPAPALPIVVLTYREGECGVWAQGEVFNGQTLRDAVGAAFRTEFGMQGEEG